MRAKRGLTPGDRYRAKISSAINDEEVCQTRLLTIASPTAGDGNQRSVRHVHRFANAVVKVGFSAPGKGQPSSLTREFQALLFCLGIPGVPRPRDLIQTGAVQALILEAIEGRRLDECRTDLPLLTVLRRLAVLLARVSARGIAHNDVLPRNILVTSQGTVGLVDFDQATEHSRLVALTRNFVGARPAAPEPAYGSLFALAIQEISLRGLPDVAYRHLHALARASVYRLNSRPARRHEGLTAARPASRARRAADVRRLHTPVLMLVYNRPELTIEVLQRLRDVRPTTMFVAADGPSQRPLDRERCEATRRLLRLIDWPCDLYTLFQPHNLGCKAGPEAGITWFFEAVEAGIVLEDDCVPRHSFFPYCSELLDRHRDHERIMMISGTNRLGRWRDGEQSYHLSVTGSVWGWATWRRAWRKHDPAMSRWGDPTVRAALQHMLSRREFARRRRQFDRVAEGFDAWDWPWTFTCLLHDGLCATPSRNLVANIGFRSSATHTKRRGLRAAGLATYELEFPLRVPAVLLPDAMFDAAVTAQETTRRRRALEMIPEGARRRAKDILW